VVTVSKNLNNGGTITRNLLEGKLVWLIFRFHETRRKGFHFSHWERDDGRWI